MNLENKGEELKGKAKEAYGDATDNNEAKAEGFLDQAKAKASQLGDDIKNAVNNAREKLTDNDDEPGK